MPQGLKKGENSCFRSIINRFIQERFLKEHCGDHAPFLISGRDPIKPMIIMDFSSQAHEEEEEEQ